MQQSKESQDLSQMFVSQLSHSSEPRQAENEVTDIRLSIYG